MVNVISINFPMNFAFDQSTLEEHIDSKFIKHYFKFIDNNDHSANLRNSESYIYADVDNFMFVWEIVNNKTEFSEQDINDAVEEVHNQVSNGLFKDFIYDESEEYNKYLYYDEYYYYGDAELKEYINSKSKPEVRVVNRENPTLDYLLI